MSEVVPVSSSVTRFWSRLATAMSESVSASKSPVASAAGMPRPACDPLWTTPTAPCPTNCDTVFEPSFAVARSSLPSLLKSAPAMDSGEIPEFTSSLGENVPSPMPRRIETREARATFEKFHVSSLPGLSEKRRINVAAALSGELLMRYRR